MMFMGTSPRPPLVGAAFEHIAGPTKPIIGVVRSKATGQPLKGSGSTARRERPGRRSRPGPTRRAASVSSACPRARSIKSTPTKQTGVAPFLDARITVTDTEGLKPIETTIELPRGVVVTGRLIDPATGRPVRARSSITPSCRPIPTTGWRPGHGSPTDPTFRMTVPPGEGHDLCRGPREGSPLHPRPAEEGRQGEGRRRHRRRRDHQHPLNSYHAYKIIDVPADAESFHVDLELTRGYHARVGWSIPTASRSPAHVLRPEPHLGRDEDARR